jgi:transposase
MQTIATIGLDIAKLVFQVHGVDAGGQAIIRRQLKRRYVLAFFQKLTPFWSVSKPAPRHTIDRANCRHGVTPCGWRTALLARRPTKIAAIALANKRSHE